MTAKKLKDLKLGTWFIKNPIEYPQACSVWIRGEYDRSTKKYLCTKWGDINFSALISGNTLVYDDFIF